MSPLYMIFVAILVERLDADDRSRRATVPAPVLTVQKTTPTSIDLKWVDFYTKYSSDYNYAVDGGDAQTAASDVITISGREPSTEFGVKAKAKHLGVMSEEFSGVFCTSPLAATVSEVKDGTTLTLTVKTGESTTTGLYIEFNPTIQQAPTLYKEDGVTQDAQFVDTSQNRDLSEIKVTFKPAPTSSTTYKVKFENFPDPAPTYTVIPYFKGGKCSDDAKYSSDSSFANKVSLEGMFVYGVVGLMALILRALGLDFCGWF